MQLGCFAQMRRSVPASTSPARVMPGLPPFSAWHTIAQSSAHGPFTLAHWGLISKALAQHMSWISQGIWSVLRKACAVRRRRHPLAQRSKPPIRPEISAAVACWTSFILPVRNPILVSVRATFFLSIRQNMRMSEDLRNDTMLSARPPIIAHTSVTIVVHGQLVEWDLRSNADDRRCGPKP